MELGRPEHDHGQLIEGEEDLSGELIWSQEMLDKIEEEFKINFSDEESTEPPATPPASAVSSQPLSGTPAKSATVDDILSGSPSSSTRRIDRRGDGTDMAKVLRGKVEAQRQIDAAREIEADKATAKGQAPGRGTRTENQSGSVNPSIESSKRSKGKPRTSPYAQEGRGNPHVPLQTLKKAPMSPAEREMLRLKDRQSLHRLGRS